MRIYPITNNILDFLIYINKVLRVEFDSFKTNSDSDLVEFLQNSCFEIQEYLNNSLEHLQRAPLKHSEFELLKLQAKKLLEIKKIFIQELSSQGSEENQELAFFYSEVKHSLNRNQKFKIIENQLQYNEFYEYVRNFDFQNNKEIEKITPNLDNTHTNIFKENGFKVWKYMFEAFHIKESSRTDIKFMFETMKYDELIHSNVRQKDILNWINSTYEMVIEKPRAHNWKDDKKRQAIYQKAKDS